MKDNYLYLNPMPFDGYYKIMNNQTYLGQETATFLLKHFGYDIDVMKSTKTVRIDRKSKFIILIFYLEIGRIFL